MLYQNNETWNNDQNFFMLTLFYQNDSKNWKKKYINSSKILTITAKHR